MSDNNCIRCKKTVRPRQEAILCDIYVTSGHTGHAIQKHIKEQIQGDVFEPAASIVDKIFNEHVDTRLPQVGMPKYDSIVRNTNRQRQKTRPKDPDNLDFELDTDFIDNQISPDFLRADIRVGSHRHLLFATDHQLSMLGKAKTWYVDGTFKIVRKPFTQLFSIHCFVKSEDDDMKQFPGAFILMSRRKKKDYKEVFKHLEELMPTAPALREMVADFESGVWRAAESVFDGLTIRGCVFHWCQAVWRHVQSLGLQVEYSRRDSMYKFIRKVFGFPFLPVEQIPPTFEQFKEMARESSIPALNKLMEYIENTWMNEASWQPEAWCAFQRAIRSNNDVEGWHHRMNRKAKKGNLPFYVLLVLLHEEAASLPLNLKLVSSGKLKRHQSSKSKKTHCKIFKYWELYENNVMSVNTLLRKCGNLYGHIHQ